MNINLICPRASTCQVLKDTIMMDKEESLDDTVYYPRCPYYNTNRTTQVTHCGQLGYENGVYEA